MTFFFGLVALLVALLAVLGVSRVPTALLVTTVRTLLVVGGVMAAVLLFYAGRHLLAALGPLATIMLWRVLPELVIRWLRRRPASGASTDGAATASVSTAHLAMTLDQGSGATRGEILSGRFAGRTLDTQTIDELHLLRGEVAGDAQSLALLDAWLDRMHPQWRSHAPAAASGPMTGAEALEILGLTDGATPEQIKAAHRELLRKVHPDSGGSTWLAARINQARDVLLP